MPEVKDHGWSHVEAATRAAMGNIRVKVGVQGEAAAAPKASRDDGDDSPLNLAEVAAINELGIGVPERSFLGDTFDEGRAELENVSTRVANGVLAGRFTFERGLSILGMHHQSQIKRRIRAGINPPNAPATVAKKGSSTPLVDTAQLISGITYAVERGSGS